MSFSKWVIYFAEARIASVVTVVSVAISGFSGDRVGRRAPLAVCLLHPCLFPLTFAIQRNVGCSLHIPV